MLAQYVAAHPDAAGPITAAAIVALACFFLISGIAAVYGAFDARRFGVAGKSRPLQVWPTYWFAYWLAEEPK